MKKTPRSSSSPKLVLGRETIRTLDLDQLKEVAGGIKTCPLSSNVSVTHPQSMNC